MDTATLVALLSLTGTLAGSLFGVLAANKLVMFRLEQLERKVDKHNNLIERMALVERDVKTVFSAIEELKEERADEY
mgnify:CR=1 FL=1